MTRYSTKYIHNAFKNGVLNRYLGANVQCSIIYSIQFTNPSTEKQMKKKTVVYTYKRMLENEKVNKILLNMIA